MTGAVTVAALAVSAAVLANRPEVVPKSATLTACAVAESTRATVDVSEWASDNAVLYADVPRFNEPPDPYQTIWMHRLETAGIGSQTDSDGTDADEAYLLDLAQGTSATSLGDTASLLYWIAGAVTPTPQSRDVIAAAAQTLLSSDRYASTIGQPATPLSTARVALALSWQDVPVPAAVLDTLADELRVDADNRGGVQSVSDRELQATIIQALVLNDRAPEATLAKAALTAWIDETTSGALTLESLAPLYALVSASRVVGSEAGPGAVTLAPEFEAFDNGWFGVNGSVAPDPQVTYYLHALGLDARPLTLDWGAVEGGWRSIQGPSLAASGIWATISTQCGIDYPASRSETGELLDRELTNEALTPQTAVQLGHLARAADADFDATKATTRLNALHAAASADGDWAGAARAKAAADEMQVTITDPTELPDKPAGPTSVELYASQLLKSTPGATTSHQESQDGALNALSRDGLYAYTPDTPEPDIISTSYLADRANRDKIVDSFTSGAHICEVPPRDGKTETCNATLLSLAAAVALEGDNRSMWW